MLLILVIKSNSLIFQFRHEHIRLSVSTYKYLLVFHLHPVICREMQPGVKGDTGRKGEKDSPG